MGLDFGLGRRNRRLTILRNAAQIVFPLNEALRSMTSYHIYVRTRPKIVYLGVKNQFFAAPKES
jgi:hypothetical protein